MKYTFLFSPFLLVSGAYLWMSASAGVADVQMQDRTGSPVSSNACNMCHQGASFNVTTNLQLIDQNGSVVTQYEPNSLYTVKATINAPNASHFGFQITGLDEGNNGIGEWTPITSGTKKVILNNRPYFEQNSALGTNVFESEWLAPGVGSGNVTFYGSALAVNRNGTASGDTYASFDDLVITEATGLSVKEISNNGFELYPVPAKQHITVGADNTINHIAIYSLTGQLAAEFEIAGTLDISPLNPGTYLIQVTFEDDTSQIKRFIKE